jgi:ribonucleoside-triphosphate reductase (thioredoxin)
MSNKRKMIFDVPENSPFETVGLFTYLRTYARRHDEENPNSTIETWQECIERVVNACNTQLKVDFTKEEMQEVFTLLYNLKMSVAGRFLWQLGTKTVDRLGMPSLQNCAFVVVDEPIRPFTFTMNMLCLGAGVGYNILPHHVEKLPIIKYAMITRKDTKDADFIVPDSRQGWVKLLSKVLKAHFYSGEGFTYSCMLLRSKGAPIKSFGGTCGGPEILCEGLTKISTVLNVRAGQKLRPIDALDILNIIGMIVVSGNVRRSAQISIGDCKDKEYLKAKDWGNGSIPNWRAYSNNSILCNDINEIIDNDDFWQGYLGNGEAYGLVNLKLSQSCGRLGETQYPDSLAQGYNPCAEQTLESYETCCLAELFLPNITTKEELFKCATYLYRICKHSLALPCKESKETEQIVHKNFRMGIGISGYMQASEEQKSWLSDCYKYLRQFDRDYSIKHGFPPSIKIATVKPSGTLSLLSHCTAGAHPGFSQYYIRRIRISSESPLIKIAKEHGYPVEYSRNFDGTNDHTTQIISFPYSLPEGTILAENCSAIDQLEVVKRLQTEWSDNSVSISVYFNKEELPSIREWLRKNYNNSIKTVSFILHTDHNFPQPPLEKISKEEFIKLSSQCRPITSLEGVCYHEEKEENLETCSSGVCPAR